jgi:hypothetical protein
MMGRFKDYSEFCIYYDYIESDEKSKLAWDKRLKNAERQRKHRKKIRNDKKCVNMYLSTETKINLEILAKHYCVTQIELIEKCLNDMHEKVISGMTDKQIANYFNVDDK